MNLNDLMAEASYQAVKDSPLWQGLSNSECDAKAEALAKVLLARAEEWIDQEVGQLEMVR